MIRLGLRVGDSMRGLKSGLVCAAVLALSPLAAGAQNFTLAQVLAYPYVSGLTAAPHADRVSWVRDVNGVRNVWMADGPAFKARQLTQYRDDDGQEIGELTFSPDGAHLVYVRGGDHDENWPAEGNLAPDPNSSPDEAKITIWSVSPRGGATVKVAEGDEPALSANGTLAYVSNDQVWTAPLSGKGKPTRLFFDRGKDHDLHWSPDGKRLAFVSDRGDHAFIGIWSGKTAPLAYLAPSTNKDSSPRWSPDGTRIAFVRQNGDGGPPVSLLIQTPTPWSIWVADSASGAGKAVWISPDTMPGTLPDTNGGANLFWGAGDRLVFLATLDKWEHLYSVPANGGAAMLLTPGAFMIEYVNASRDGRFMVYTANTGNHADDGERRHVFRVPVDQAKPAAITAGETIEWQPAMADANHVAFISSGATRPMAATIAALDGSARRDLDPPAADFPAALLVVPKPVTFRAADGTLVHGDLFQRSGGGARPGVIFVHGGPPRQMLLGWHPMDYYDNAFAMNQYLAAHGFTVLSVNYRLGIGYGQAFYRPDHAGPAGASEYQDVVAGAHFLQAVKGVDPARIGIWGGSYGGYLTGLALARNSDIFKSGVDFHGVHDWSALIDAWYGKPRTRYETGDRAAAMKVAFQSSPIADIAHWRSPVLLIHGDDDRNVPFNQTVDLARRLADRHIPYEELILPNEIHGFLRRSSWLKADEAAAAFLTRTLHAKGD